MKRSYERPDLIILMSEVSSVLCVSGGTGESFQGESEFEGAGDWE